jgi:hypothetical protein
VKETQAISKRDLIEVIEAGLAIAGIRKKHRVTDRTVHGAAPIRTGRVSSATTQGAARPKALRHESDRRSSVERVGGLPTDHHRSARLVARPGRAETGGRGSRWPAATCGQGWADRAACVAS